MTLISARTRFIVVAGIIAVVTRLASTKPVPSVLIVGGLALAAVVVGVHRYRRDQTRAWRHAWLLMAGGLLLHVLSSLVAAVSAGGGASFPTAAEPLTLLGQGLTVAAVFVLLRHRSRGQALDILFEAVTVATALGFVVWALGIEPGAAAAPGSGVKILALTLPLVDVVALWLLTRLILLSDDHPIGYRYVLGAFLCLCTVHAVTAGSVLQNWAPPRADLNALTLWSFCLWGAAALHPSLRTRFDPVPSRPPTTLTVRQWAPVIGALLVGPAVIALQASRGQSLHLSLVLPGSLLMPLITATHLVYQVWERVGAEYRAQHDPLTGLPNQVLFHDRVVVALAGIERHQSGFALMFLDLDRFKGVNDSLGHAVGNQLLQAVANRLRRTLRAEDTVARMGGDEFTLLVPGVATTGDCEAVAEKVLAAFQEPFLVGSRELVVSTSVGIAMAPSDGTDVETLLKHADTAMYRAKASGRNAYHFFTSDMSARVQLKHAMEAALRAAIDRNELELHYQPKVDVGTTSVIGLEALVRWRHPKLGLLAPNAFIPLAEETGLIVPLGEWVLQAACQQLRLWSESGVQLVPIAVNLSARQFEQQRVEDVVFRVLQETGVDPRLLELELTESVLMHDVRATGATLETLQAMGVRCSIDDFGTGFSGLNYLAEIPIDSLKIDQSFVQKIGSTKDDAPIVGAVIALAQSLRMNVIAEGVETMDQVRFLQAHGCEQMQGFFFSRPLPADGIARVVFTDGENDALRFPPDTSTLEPCADGLSPALSAAQASSLLAAVCGANGGRRFEPAEVAAILAALELDGHVTPLGERLWRSASVRLAAGTFAGLMPLSGGLAAAGALPAPAQQLAAHVLAPVGVTVPTPQTWAAPRSGSGGGHGVAPGRTPTPRALRPPETAGDGGLQKEQRGRPEGEGGQPGHPVGPEKDTKETGPTKETEPGPDRTPSPGGSEGEAGKHKGQAKRPNDAAPDNTDPKTRPTTNRPDDKPTDKAKK